MCACTSTMFSVLIPTINWRRRYTLHLHTHLPELLWESRWQTLKLSVNYKATSIQMEDTTVNKQCSWRLSTLMSLAMRRAIRAHYDYDERPKLSSPSRKAKAKEATRATLPVTLILPCSKHLIYSSNPYFWGPHYNFEDSKLRTKCSDKGFYLASWLSWATGNGFPAEQSVAYGCNLYVILHVKGRSQSSPPWSRINAPCCCCFLKGNFLSSINCIQSLFVTLEVLELSR